MEYKSIIDEDLSMPEFYEEIQENADVRRVRSALLLLLTGELVLSLLYMAIKIYFLITYKPSIDPEHNDLVLAALVVGVIFATIIIIFLAIFLIVVVKNYRVGILIFAWISVVDLILIIFIVILAIIGLISASTAVGSDGLGLSASIVIVIGSTLALLLTASIIVCSFELARLINLQKQNLLN